MLNIIIGLIIGVLVGWNVPQPAVVKNATDKIKALVKR